MSRARRPIQRTDIDTFLSARSDFAFEMRVLAEFNRMRFNSKHSGTYTDPLQRKARQFDIRAERSDGRHTLKLAVECKNIKPSDPLVVYCVERRSSEAWHEILVYGRKQAPRLPRPGPTPEKVSPSFRYASREFVGKAVDQVRIGSDGKPESHEAEVFDKISQAINSTYELIRESAFLADHDFEHIVLPVLVLPDGVLWAVHYDEAGKLVDEPAQVGRLHYFIDRSWELPELPGFTFRLSHMEIVTFSDLRSCFGTEPLTDTELFRGTR